MARVTLSQVIDVCCKCLDGLYVFCLRLYMDGTIWNFSLDHNFFVPCFLVVGQHPYFPQKSLYLIVRLYRCETWTYFSSITLFLFTYASSLFSCVLYCPVFQIPPLFLHVLAIFASFLFNCFFLYVFLKPFLFAVPFMGSYVDDILKVNQMNIITRKLLLWLCLMNFACCIIGNCILDHCVDPCSF